MAFEPEKPVFKADAEKLFTEIMLKEGWDVTNRGSPDFFCWKANRFICVEIKPKRGRRLKAAQRRVLSSLTARGIECYKWNPQDGFVKITLPIRKI